MSQNQTIQENTEKEGTTVDTDVVTTQPTSTTSVAADPKKSHRTAAFLALGLSIFGLVCCGLVGLSLICLIPALILAIMVRPISYSQAITDLYLSLCHLLIYLDHPSLSVGCIQSSEEEGC